MVHRDWTSANDREGRLGAQAKLVVAPVASPGIRDALRASFSCEINPSAEFERLLAKLR